MVSVPSLTVPEHGRSQRLRIAGSERDERVDLLEVPRLDIELSLGGLEKDPSRGDELIVFFGNREDDEVPPCSQKNDRGWRIACNGGLNILLHHKSILTPQGNEFRWCRVRVLGTRQGKLYTLVWVEIVGFEKDLPASALEERRQICGRNPNKRVGYPMTTRHPLALAATG